MGLNPLCPEAKLFLEGEKGPSRIRFRPQGLYKYCTTDHAESREEVQKPVPVPGEMAEKKN